MTVLDPAASRFGPHHMAGRHSARSRRAAPLSHALVDRLRAVSRLEGIPVTGQEPKAFPDAGTHRCVTS